MKKLIMMVAVAMAGALSAATFKFTCDKPDGVYALGEKANGVGGIHPIVWLLVVDLVVGGVGLLA